MSYADRIFKENCREILTHGVWDTEPVSYTHLTLGHGAERPSPLGRRHPRPHGKEIRHRQPL